VLAGFLVVRRHGKLASRPFAPGSRIQPALHAGDLCGQQQRRGGDAGAAAEVLLAAEVVVRVGRAGGGGGAATPPCWSGAGPPVSAGSCAATSELAARLAFLAPFFFPAARAGLAGESASPSSAGASCDTPTAPPRSDSEGTTAVTVPVRRCAAAARLAAPEPALRRVERRRSGAESAAPTTTVTPSLLSVRSTAWACDIGISASSKARRTSSGSRYPWDRPRSISCWMTGSRSDSGCLSERVELAGDTNTSRTDVWRVCWIRRPRGAQCRVPPSARYFPHSRGRITL
jgi:hypothetical protein